MTDAADRLAIHELLSLHGLFDSGQLDRLDELFTEDVTYDVEAFGGGVLRGVAAIREAAEQLGDGNPLGHHTTNVLVGELTDESARVISKGIGVGTEGSASSVVYEDVARRTPAGWRLAARTVRPRRRPLTA